MQNLIIVITAAFVLGVGVYVYWYSTKLQKRLKEREKQMSQKVYEAAILRELGERMGYSLNVQKVVDIITGSLRQFIRYAAVSYMLLEPGKVVFKMQLEKSVSRDFVDDVKGRMLGSLSALLNKEINGDNLEETLTGAILIEDLKEPVRSYFNIPLIIGEKVVGVLTVADIIPGLYSGEETTILYKITNQASRAVTSLHEVVETEQRKVNAMVESMGEGVVMTDKNYQIIVVNPAAKELIGIEDKEDTNIFDFIEKLGSQFDIRGKLEEAIKLNKEINLKNILIGERSFKIFVSPVKVNKTLDEDDIIGGVVIFHDITKEMEAEKMKEDFTSMMVHELRSPLDGIKKMTELMKEDGEMTKVENEEYIEMIHEGSSQMLGLVNDLLDAAKISAGKFEVNKSPASIKDLIKKRIDFYTSSASKSKIKLVSEIDPNMPEQVNIDVFRMSQVLNNLISNAIKFTPPSGEVRVQAFMHKKDANLNEELEKAGIKWHVNPEENKIQLNKNCLIMGVTDTGIGLAKENLPLLFNKFKQFTSKAVSGESGTGLGLAIVKGIVEAHGGVIGVDSIEGSGTTFYLCLPNEL